MEAQKQVIEAILRLISPLFLAQNGPKVHQIMYCCTALQHTVLGKAFGEHSGVIMAILGLFGGLIAKFELL